ncbi:MAG: hypothetical protein MZV63_19770 [Marinilabiliales bacterium]|nr:hypothetical protein [Marinilabiliales bacterium]
MVAYLGTNNFIEACSRAENGDQRCQSLSVKAIAYQVSKEIGAMAAVLEGIGRCYYPDRRSGLSGIVACRRDQKRWLGSLPEYWSIRERMKLKLWPLMDYWHSTGRLI